MIIVVSIYDTRMHLFIINCRPISKLVMVIGKSTVIQFFISITFLFLTLSAFTQSSYITDCSALPSVIEMNDEFSVFVVIKNGVNLDSVVIQEPTRGLQPLSIFLNGENFTDITLYDNGLNGDVEAGDNIFTRGGLSYDYTGSLSTQNQIIFRNENVLYYSNGIEVKESLDLTTTLAIYDASQIDEPTVTIVNDEVQFATHTINIKRPSRWGEDPFPTLDYWSDNPLLDNLLCDDLFILIQGTTNNMTLNTQTAAHFLPTTTETQGLGRELSDAGYPFKGLLTVNWTRSVETFMSHEILHKWGAYDDLYGNLSNGHWGWIEMESSGLLSPSSFEFSDLKSLGNNTYEVKRNAYNAKDKHWSNLELYLAGRIGLDEVDFPIRFIDNAQVVGSATANPTKVSGTLKEISKADWLASAGPRIPAVGPEVYKIVQVIFSDELLTPGQLSYFEEGIRLSQRKILGPQYQFDPMTIYEASRGKIKLKSIYLPCTDCIDDDDDGICNDEDICPDGDDTLDSDNDGIPNACDDDNCILGSPCDDGNPCTEGEYEITSTFDGSVCIPCGNGVPSSNCDEACSSQLACDDNDPCTEGEYEVYAADGSLCEACGNGIPSGNCEESCTTQLACDDGDPCTEGEYEVYAADGSLCEACGNGTEIENCCQSDLLAEIGQECDEQTGEAIVVVALANGTPPYNISSDVFVDSAYGDDSFQVTLLAEEQQAVSFDITDAVGCTASVSLELTSCNKLPIELLSFTGEVLEEGNELNWVTATERDLQHFNLMRSVDGNIFEEIAKVETKGNVTTATSYEYLDKDAPNGVSYYRLDAIEVDGSETQSYVISLIRGEVDFGITQVSPIPTLDQLYIGYLAPENGEIELEIYDLTGRILIKEIMNAEIGDNKHQLDVSNLLAGMYLIQIRKEEAVFSHKFIKE